MKRIDEELAKSIKGGGMHYHWICFGKKIYVSAPYKSSVITGDMVDVQGKKYKRYKKRMVVYSCWRNCRK